MPQSIQTQRLPRRVALAGHAAKACGRACMCRQKVGGQLCKVFIIAHTLRGRAGQSSSASARPLRQRSCRTERIHAACPCDGTDKRMSRLAGPCAHARCTAWPLPHPWHRHTHDGCGYVIEGTGWWMEWLILGSLWKNPRGIISSSSSTSLSSSSSSAAATSSAAHHHDSS